jgi:hypothetical protein
MIRYEYGGSCKSIVEIKNTYSKNIAYKIKTTAPKVFVVKPISGVIPPGMIIACKVQSLVTKQSDRDICKNKFMI